MKKVVALCSCAVGWGRDYRNEGFGEQNGIKHQLVAVITAVQTLLRGEYVLTDVTGDVFDLKNKTKAKLILIYTLCQFQISCFRTGVERMFVSKIMSLLAPSVVTLRMYLDGGWEAGSKL